MLRCALAAFLALALVLLTMPARTALAPVASAAELPASISNVYIHLPRDLPVGTPVQVLVALHGMTGAGELFGSRLLATAEHNHWLLVAPTIRYGDWTDPSQVAGEDPRLIRWLSDYLDHLSDYVGVPVKPRVLVIGHSRGAQLAHSFALFQPERVMAVAALGAGTYTLPVAKGPEGSLISFPFGLADLADVTGHGFSPGRLIGDTDFFLGVGSDDNNPGDLPRAWDQYIGTTRVQRAHAFQTALHKVGARAVLVAFPGERHAMSAKMEASASSFLRADELFHAECASVVGSPAAVRGPRSRPHF